MPSKPADTALRDILHHIDLATHFAAGFHPTSFHDDLRTVYAVTRCLEDVEARFVWETVQRDLPLLRAVIAHELD